ncbi:electron transfer flavoprotein subunit alpha/FixB family protein [Algihabitans albus]|uniref:electron transfer flavoprotein subunit alpha/FixB family protein n=1 Tax=Algihabitans albus TaxID=2164067 RepID=UPI000E5C6079|nr:FAD-binding protein [Algihabitans albus]
MTVLVVAETENNALKGPVLNTVAAAKALSAAGAGEIHILVAGAACDGAASEAAKIEGIAKVVKAEAPAYAHSLAEAVAPLIAELAGDYSHVLVGHTTFGRNVLPRAAALCDMQMVSDVSAVEGTDTFVRPIYAGNALATVQSHDKIVFLSVRGTAFDAAAGEGGGAEIVAAEPAEDPGLSSFVGHELTESERPELTSARVVVSGGRGMQNGENFAMLETLADKLGAAVGASRAAVDAGYVPNDYQVGQTGKVVAPDLYIAVGISGAIQHLAGMKDSKVIVAINKDEEAPIFQVADYGLVADLFQAVPELEAELDKSA